MVEFNLEDEPKLRLLAKFALIDPDTIIPDSNAVNALVFAYRLDIEFLLTALWNKLSENPDDGEIKDNIETLLNCLKGTSRGVHAQDVLDYIESKLHRVSQCVSVETTPKTSPKISPRTSTIEHIANLEEDGEHNTLIFESSESKKNKKKRKKAGITPVIKGSSLVKRFLNMMIDLIYSFPGESLHHINSEPGVILLQNILRYLSWILPSIRFTKTVGAAILYANGYQNAAAEQNIPWNLRFLYQIKKKESQLIGDFFVALSFGVLCISTYSNYSPECRQARFGFIVILTLAYEWKNSRAFSQFISNSKNADKNKSECIAVEKLKRKISAQNYLQLIIRAAYLLGASIAVIGKESNSSAEKIELLIGSSIIVLTCIAQFVWEHYRKNPLNIEWISPVQTLSKNTTPSQSEVGMPTASSGESSLEMGWPQTSAEEKSPPSTNQFVLIREPSPVHSVSSEVLTPRGNF